MARRFNHPFSIDAPWGETQRIEDGWLAINPDNPEDMYGIDANAFEQTYVEENSSSI